MSLAKKSVWLEAYFSYSNSKGVIYELTTTTITKRERKREI